MNEELQAIKGQGRQATYPNFASVRTVVQFEDLKSFTA